jgi:nudix-type nucleoside diphosphatase (YffH/AdpP family)
MIFRPRVNIRKTDRVYDGWAKLTRYELDIEQRDGGTETVIREVHDHGHGAGVLPYDPSRDTVLLVRQFRLPPHVCGADGMLIEACAGLLDGDEPEHCARREAEEELGYRVHDLQFITRAWMTPGSVTESVYLFSARYSGTDRLGTGGGKYGEDEDIEVLELAAPEAWTMVLRGEISDAKTVILLQDLEMRKRGLK